MSEVFSQARVDYCVQLSVGSPVTYRTAYSNMVSTVLINQVLAVARGVNKTHTAVYDILTYTVAIKNLTPLAIQQVGYRDELPPALFFITGSATVNAQSRPDISPPAGFIIDQLPPMGTVTISFSVVILPTAAAQVSSRAVLKLLFSSNRLLSPVALEAVSNTTVTYVEHSLFKESLVRHTLQFSNVPSATLRVVSVKTTLSLMQAKLVTTAVKQLSQYPDIPVVLLVCDIMVAYEITYQTGGAGRASSSLHRTTYHRACREALLVPKGVEYIAQPTPVAQATSTSYRLQGNSLLCNVSLLLIIE